MNKGIGGIIADYGKDDSFTRIAPTERMLEKTQVPKGRPGSPAVIHPGRSGLPQASANRSWDITKEGHLPGLHTTETPMCS